jgi:mgtE-like transporter
MRILQKDFDEILTGELFSLSGGLLAGFLLTFATDKLYLIPGLFILYPGFLEMRGNISGSLSARITSGLFVGVAKYGHEKKNIIKGNIIASVFLIVVISLFLGLLAYYMSSEIFGIHNFNIVYIALFAGIVSNLIEVPLTIATTYWLFKHGHDPNNVMGPYVTTTGDITSVLSLLIAIAVIA